MATIIYGASDDLLEIEGDISEEFDVLGYVEDDKLFHLACSDGTLIRVQYDQDGMWRLDVVMDGTARFSKVSATDPEDDYSDRITFHDPLRWIALCAEYARAK